MSVVDLSRLPPPKIIDALDFEALFLQRKAALIALYPADQRAAVAETLSVEAEPLVMLLQENCYRELLLRQRINEAAQGVMLAYARGTDLDHLAANVNVARLLIEAGDSAATSPKEPTFEEDRDLRLRIQQAFEGLSVAGPRGAYEFFARSASGLVADAAATSPSPACVTVTILSRDNNGQASAALLETVRQALNDENVRPVGDRVTVQAAEIIAYRVQAKLYVLAKPEIQPIERAANARLQALIADHHRLGRDIRLSAIYAALHVEGVRRVELTAPSADILVTIQQAAWCSEALIEMAAADEK